jgi:hypothetical protein
MGRRKDAVTEIKKGNQTEQEWVNEFSEFISSDPHHPPSSVEASLLKTVKRDLHPLARYVFAKLALIHLFVGTSTLLICPQFNVHLLPGMGLMTVFEKFGQIGCTIACGALFLSGSFLLASLVLRPEEVRAIRRTRFAQLLGISIISIGIFLLFGASAVMVGALAWLLGSLSGGLASLELGWLFRSRLRRRLAYGF